MLKFFREGQTEVQEVSKNYSWTLLAPGHIGCGARIRASTKEEGHIGQRFLPRQASTEESAPWLDACNEASSEYEEFIAVEVVIDI